MSECSRAPGLDRLLDYETDMEKEYNAKFVNEPREGPGSFSMGKGGLLARRKRMCKKTIFWFLLICLVFVMASCEFKADKNIAVAEKIGSRKVIEAMNDLASRLGVRVSEISLITERRVTWRDGSLGCPKEGMMYTQALVEGTLIVLRVKGRDYQYHSGQGRGPFYCENPVSSAPRSFAD